MPPIARLTPDQAIYHFISGYTSKIAGTEIGLGVEPVITFSTCFGGPFMVHHPYVYADMLKARLLKQGATCWLVNTGWTGGPFGIGKRIAIRHTRNLLDAALTGKLNHVSFRLDPVFGFEVPAECDGVPSQMLDPALTWGDREAYDRQYRALAARFIENFKVMADGCPAQVANAGPRVAAAIA
jgi:phosphoenolpyruvate carboxykinase (ATP)